MKGLLLHLEDLLVDGVGALDDDVPHARVIHVELRLDRLRHDVDEGVGQEEAPQLTQRECTLSTEERVGAERLYCYSKYGPRGHTVLYLILSVH